MTESSYPLEIRCDFELVAEASVAWARMVGGKMAPNEIPGFLALLEHAGLRQGLCLNNVSWGRIVGYTDQTPLLHMACFHIGEGGIEEDTAARLIDGLLHMGSDALLSVDDTSPMEMLLLALCVAPKDGCVATQDVLVAVAKKLVDAGFRGELLRSRCTFTHDSLLKKCAEHEYHTLAWVLEGYSQCGDLDRSCGQAQGETQRRAL